MRIAPERSKTFGRNKKFGAQDLKIRRLKISPTENFATAKITVRNKIDRYGIPSWDEEQVLSFQALWGPTHMRTNLRTLPK